MKRRMRTLLMVLLVLASGAIVNVTVAWGCAVQPARHGRTWLDRPQGYYGFTSTSTGATTTIWTDPGRLSISQAGPGMNVDYVIFPEIIGQQQFELLVPAWS